MPSIINSDDGVVSGTSGLKSTGGNDGLLNIQSNGSTIVAVTGSGISVTGTVSQTGVSTFAAGTVSAPSITFTGDTNTGIFSPAADTIAFSEGGVESMRIDSSGNVLVGTTSGDITGTTTKISANGGTGFAATNVNTGTGTYSVYRLGNANNTNRGGVGLFGSAYTTSGLYRQDGMYIYATGNGGMTLAVESNQPMYFGTNNTERMRIDSSGNVGIGTSSPFAPLDAVTNGSADGILLRGRSSDNISNISLTSNTAGTVYAQIQGRSTDLRIQTNSTIPMVFYTNATERMRINAGAPILCLSGGNTSATGTGIAFPATQSASSDANTLDDYEEGSWTPALYDGASNRNPTYLDGPSGTYQKIGKWVYVRWGFRINSKGTAPGSGEVRIYGLPFTSVNIGSYQEPNVSVGTGNLVTAANAGIARMVVINSGTHLFGRVSNNADTTWTYNELQTGSWIIGEVFYETTA